VKIVYFFLLFVLMGCGSVQKMTDERSAGKAYVQGVETEVLPELTESSANCPKDTLKIDVSDWKGLVSAANECAKMGAYKKVEQIADVIAKNHRFSPWGPYFHSLCDEKSANYPLALWYIDLALRKAEIGLFHFQRARLLWKMNEKLQGIESFELALKLDPKLWMANQFLGLVYYEQNDWSNARRHLEKAAEAKGSSYETHFALANIFSSEKEDQKALESYKQALKRDRKSSTLQARIAEVEKRLDAKIERTPSSQTTPEAEVKK